MGNRTVAVLTTWLDGWYQSQLWRGAVESARSHGVRLLTLVGYAQPDEHMPAGPESILGLAGRQEIEGVLLSSGPLSFWDGPAALRKICSWLPQQAVVSLGFDFAGIDSVLPDGGGISEIVEHMSKAHACRRIAFLGGPELNPDAIRRLEDYRSALSKAGIRYSPELVECGGFYLEGGMAAMERLLAKDIRIDAVVAANDTMAIGAAKVLALRGYKIPGDILLTGYDDTLEGQFLQPPLTTVANPTHLIAYKGLEMCLDRMVAPVGLRRKSVVETQVRIRRSCGCLGSIFPGTTATCSGNAGLLEEALHHLLDPEDFQHGEFLYWLQSQLAEATDRIECEIYPVFQALVEEVLKRGPALQLPELFGQLSKGMMMISDARQAKLSEKLLHQESLIRDLHRTSNALLAHPDPELMTIRLAECIRDWCPSGIRLFMLHEDFSPAPPADMMKTQFSFRVEIKHGKLIPIPEEEDLLPSTVVPGEIWTGVPLEQANMRFGVVLFRNWDQNEAFIEHLRLAFSTAFSISWRTRSEDRMRETLHRLAVRDELTNLYNRRGLSEVSRLLIQQALREKKVIGIFCIDMDDLKLINDRFGHADGDMAICTLANALQACFRGTDVQARLGGDEFAVVSMLHETSELQILSKRFGGILYEMSDSLQKPWKLRASIGALTWDPTDGSSLESEMRKADKLLYDVKFLKKQGLEPPR